MEGLEQIYYWSQKKRKKIFSHIEDEDIKKWILINTNFYETFTYEFESESKFNDWGDGFFDPWNPWPREASHGLLWETMKGLVGDHPSTEGFNLLDIRDHITNLLRSASLDQLDQNYSFGVVVGSFENEENAKSYVADEFPDAKILKFDRKGEDGKIESLYRVVTYADRFTKFVDVLEKRNEIRENGPKDAWITIIPNDALESGNYSSDDGQREVEKVSGQ